jgi:hypothetical protein
MARAMATRCFCPPDSWLPRVPQCVAYLRSKPARQTEWSEGVSCSVITGRGGLEREGRGGGGEDGPPRFFL